MTSRKFRSRYVFCPNCGSMKVTMCLLANPFVSSCPMDCHECDSKFYGDKAIVVYTDDNDNRNCYAKS